MMRCAITDLRFARENVLRWARDGVDFVQLRDKSSTAGALAAGARELLRLLAGSTTRLLINGRADVAVAAGAAGVHLTSSPGELTVAQVRQLFASAGRGAAVVSASCHRLDEVEQARRDGADFVLFGPVFEKRVEGRLVSDGTGLEMLRAAIRTAGTMPVLALGGVDSDNAALCLAAGAAGIAGIRLFVEGASES